MANPPALGEVAPGQLLVDPQTLTIWVGVDPTVNPAGALLVCDMQALAAADTQILIDAKSYTDNMLNGSLTPNSKPYTQEGHKHVAADITDFGTAVVDAVGTNLLPKGAIIMWSGPASQVGVGNLKDWAVCDGSNHPDYGQLPNLVNRFVVGSSDKPGNVSWCPRGTGSDDDVTHNPPDAWRQVAGLPAGSHSHTGSANAHTLTTAEMPTHRHRFATDYYPGGFSGYTDTVLVRFGTTQNTWDITTSGTEYAQGFMTDVGGGLGHVHESLSIVEGGSHAHNFYRHPQNVPWFALCYIVKVR